jgi:hypothetical protein
MSPSLFLAGELERAELTILYTEILTGKVELWSFMTCFTHEKIPQINLLEKTRDLPRVFPHHVENSCRYQF